MYPDVQAHGHEHHRRTSSATSAASATPVQIRLDILNFGNLLNSNWGVSQRTVLRHAGQRPRRFLTNPAVDAQGRATYRLATVEQRAGHEHVPVEHATGDVYQFMLSFRYTFN